MQIAAGAALVLAARGAWVWRGVRHGPAAIAWAAAAATLAALAAVAAQPWDMAAALAAGQLVLAWLAPPSHRRLLPATGHLTAAGGLAALVLMPGSPVGLLAVAAGLGLLVLHAHWQQRQARPELGGWSLVLVALLALGLGAIGLWTTLPLAGFALPAPWPAVMLGTAAGCGLAAGALLCGPPRAPSWLQPRPGAALDVVLHGAAAMALLNLLFLGLSLVSTWSLRLLFGALFVWQAAVIVMEYRTVTHAEKRRRKALARPMAAPEPITVIVPACDEAHVLPSSMAHNLALDLPLRFILVPATKSQDLTVAVAHSIARTAPDRVQVIEGGLGSKAAELNLAWAHVKTDWVLLLDADETIDRDSLLRGLAALKSDPGIGVVQGRKVSREPDRGFLARFVSAERRYCTWMDHVMHAEDLGSSHFGGSAALLRREVPEAVGGWTDRTLTEDIEFTLRLHLDGRHRIVYLPEMVVRESDPVTTGDLLRQRTRWARGWAQCFRLYLPDVVRKRRQLGARKTLGLMLLLTISVSALWTTLVPATMLLRLAGVSPILPLALAIPLTLLLLPARLLAYGYAALRDPVIPLQGTPKRLSELALHAYLWILVGWFVQLHALVQELASAPKTWFVTAKRAPTPAATPDE